MMTAAILIEMLIFTCVFSDVGDIIINYIYPEIKDEDNI